MNLSSWDDLSQRKQLAYFSVWDVRELAVYDRVTFLANSFDKLITFRLIQALYPEIAMQAIQIGRQQMWAARDVLINYFAEDHRAGSSFFDSTETGKRAVQVWSEWVRTNVDEAAHFWCANKARAVLNLPGQRVSPKIAGSNAYRNLTQCSVLYSAKASGPENRVFASRHLFESMEITFEDETEFAKFKLFHSDEFNEAARRDAEFGANQIRGWSHANAKLTTTRQIISSALIGIDPSRLEEDDD